MITEILLILAGHSDEGLFRDQIIHPTFAPLLHPGEKQCLESLGTTASRYRRIKLSCENASASSSRYIRALSATLDSLLTEEYEALVLSTEAKVLHRDPELVASGSFVPLSAIRTIFAPWDTPFCALVSLFDELEARETWPPGPLIDLLLHRCRTGVHRVADIFLRLSNAVQRVWRSQVMAFMFHGSLSRQDPLASSSSFALLPGSMPSCVSAEIQDSISYVGRAIATVKAAKWQAQPPRSMALEQTKLLESVLPENQHAFNVVIQRIRVDVSEWLWSNVLTRSMVEDAVESLSNYFLLRNGEFSLALIREIDQLKTARLTSRSGSAAMIREQDLNTALLRASLGTTAQQDPALALLAFSLPSGPLRPLLPSLANTSRNRTQSNIVELTEFDDLLLGSRLLLSYSVTWPLDLFLHPSELQIYAALFSYLSSLRKTHTRLHTCWTSLSNAQRARRRWTGLSEGGTAEDLDVRKQLLRCGWGVVRDMGWFLDTVLGYVMTDVVDTEYRSLKNLLSRSTASRPPASASGRLSASVHSQDRGGIPPAASSASVAPGLHSGNSLLLDFTTLRTIHTTYLERVYTGCLLSYPSLSSTLRDILDTCERFVAHVERWGGDVLPALLFEGSINGEDKVGAMVQERWEIVAEINNDLHRLFTNFYDQLSLSISQQPLSDASKSMMMNGSTTDRKSVV